MPLAPSRSVTLSDVIDREVESFIAQHEQGFDKREIEMRIEASPEFRRIHHVQTTELIDLDIEHPILFFMKSRVRSALAKMKDTQGERTLIAVRSGAGSRRFTWYNLRKMRVAQLESLKIQWELLRDHYASRVVVVDKLITAMKKQGPNTTVGDVYDTVLDSNDKAVLIAELPTEPEDE